MHSKFFQHSNIATLQEQLDDFLKDLDEVTGQIANIDMLHHNNDIIILIIYNCWKKL